MRRTWAVIGLVVLGLALVGCGGGDDGGGDSGGDEAADEPTTTTEERISEDDWVDEAHDACIEWHHDSSDLVDAGLDDEEYFDRLTGYTEDFADAVGELGTPEDIEEEADDLVDAIDDLLEVLDGAQDAIDDGSDEAADAFGAEFDDASDGVDEAADDAGLDCVSEPEVPATTVPVETVPSTDSGVTSVLDLTPIEPSVGIPEYGSDLLFDSYADLCFNGDMSSCDELYRQSDVSDSIFSYEGYGATCGGRLTEEAPGQCVSLSGGQG